MRLARLDETPVSIGTVQTIVPGDAENTCLHVPPGLAGRRRGTGPDAAADRRLQGPRVSRMLMASGTGPTAARRLYDALGFRRRRPYKEMPERAKGRFVSYEMHID